MKNMECITTVPKKITINTCGIDYKPWYMLSASSIGQIIMAINMVSVNKTTTPYEKYMSQWFEQNIPSFVSKYENLFDCKNDIEYNTYSYNLIGNLPRGLLLDTAHTNITLGKANLGNLLKALKQRTEFILTRHTPIYYINNKEYYEYFVEMKTKLTKFKKSICEFEIDFVGAINGAHKMNFKQDI